MAEHFSRHLNIFTNFFMKLRPSLKADLEHAGIDFNSRKYISISLVASILIAFTTMAIILVIGSTARPIVTVIPQAVLFSFLAFIVMMFYYLSYPKLILMKRNKLLDRDLLFSLRYILIRIRSGVPLYDAMVSVSQGDYGLVSSEFKKTIEEISSGTNEINALENMAIRNPSEFFRRTIWQIANNMRSGTDISSILEGLTSNLVEEHKILVRKYGSELNPIILMYMMFSVIIPALSITVLVVMSSFSGVQVPVAFFYAIPIAIFVIQIFFISIIKNKKPVLSI